jgi:hypothetical protein
VRKTLSQRQNVYGLFLLLNLGSRGRPSRNRSRERGYMHYKACSKSFWSFLYGHLEKFNTLIAATKVSLFDLSAISQCKSVRFRAIR